MARKTDSGWRDSALNEWHVRNGFPCPVAGMVLPMIEYDRGQSVGLVNYIPRGERMPSGAEVAATYRAFGRLHNDTGGAPLPFLTAVYDPRNWAMELFAHNESARKLVATYAEPSFSSWVRVTEAQFAQVLFAMRGRQVPDMFGFDVEWSADPWFTHDAMPTYGEQSFPCADMSARRRTYEPDTAAPMRVKVPCLDVDLAVVDQDDRLALVIDYKRPSALCDVKGTNATALASLATGYTASVAGYPNEAVDRSTAVAAMMVRYWGDGRWFEAFPLNRSASTHLSYVLGASNAQPDLLARAVAGDQWVRLSESQWLDVLRVARGL